MKKHPVDDLFKRRLADLDKKPSENAWLRIHENTEARRRPAVWIWYAAASVSLALLAGYLVWVNDQKGLMQHGANQKVVATVTTKKNPETVKPKLETGNESIKTEIAVDEALLLETKKTVVIKSKALKDKLLSNEKLVEEEVESTIASVEKTSVSPNSTNVIDLSGSPVIEGLKPSAGGDELPGLKKEKAEQAITIVVAVDSDEKEMEEKPKNSRFSRVFRQLKNARAGEKVDWEEVGFNPKNLVARVDDRLRTKEEKASEKNQNPKERTKL